MPVTRTFPLSLPNLGASVTSASEGQRTTSGSPDFLGYGLATPFRRGASDFASNGGFEHVRSCVSQILGTDGASGVASGEIPWKPGFGSRFYLLKHRKGDLLRELARVYAREALARHEPRVRVTDIVGEFDESTRSFRTVLYFNLIDKNTPGNKVILADQRVEIDLELA